MSNCSLSGINSLCSVGSSHGRRFEQRIARRVRKLGHLDER